MHICEFFWEGGEAIFLSFMPVYHILKFKSNIHQNNIITLHYTENKFLQFGLEWNKHNKSLNHATLKLHPSSCNL